MREPVVDPVVRRELWLDAERDAVWAMLADADGLAEWLADEVALEVVPGAEGEIGWEDGERRRVVVEEVAERRRVVLRWWQEDGPESLVELTLDDVDGGTRLVVVELPVVALRAVGRWLPAAVGPGPAAPGAGAAQARALACA
ncbi:SRPBCC domain-containing protein [Patulibacter defluvii]|uniref:SRPBCC domain-containing protein n=1 Tax=Patulibacter defluvii TaxID=3095358 RepID=UPI002A75E654|nr:SRPBCC domain-containing protein [Patulibacter sp. DM4]